MQKNITLTVNDTDLLFNVDSPTYDKYINELMPHNKIAPAKNFLRRCIAPESREALTAVLEMPGASVQLAAALLEDFMPDLEISVGKSKPAPLP